jgi:hypothetical protein
MLAWVAPTREGGRLALRRGVHLFPGKSTRTTRDVRANFSLSRRFDNTFVLHLRCITLMKTNGDWLAGSLKGSDPNGFSFNMN